MTVNIINTKNNKGFTLIELIVVISIVVTLSAVAFMGYSSYTINARDYKRVSDVAMLKVALNSYQKNHMGQYYVPETAISAGVIYSGALSNVISYQMDFDKNIAEVMNMEKIPLDPTTNKNYIYSVSADKLNYQIATVLENPETKISFIANTAYASADCENLTSYVEGSYIPKDINILAGLIYAFDYKKENLNISLEANRKKVVLNKQNINLVYDKKGNPRVCNTGNVLDTPIVTNKLTITDKRSCTINSQNIEDGGNVVMSLSGTTVGTQIGWKYQTCNDGQILPSASSYYYTCKNIGAGTTFGSDCTWSSCKTGYVARTDGTPGCIFEGGNVVLTYPTQGAFGLPTAGTIAWYATQGGNNEYKVYLSNDSALEGNIISGQSVGSNLKYNYSNLEVGTTYYWKIQTKSMANPSKTLESERRSFTVLAPGTGTGASTVVNYYGSGAAQANACPAGVVCRADETYISYVGGNGDSYEKHNFGISKRDSDNLYGKEATVVYKIENKSDGISKFKVKLADMSTGTGMYNYLTKTTSFNSQYAVDIMGDGTTNLYMDLGTDCIDTGTTEYQVKARTTCIVKFFARTDATFSALNKYSSGSLNFASFFIENTDKLNSNWENNTTLNGQGDTNKTYTTSTAPIPLPIKATDYQIDLLIAFDSLSGAGAGPLTTTGAYTFGRSDRTNDDILGNTNTLKFKIENRSDASAYFKLKAADVSSGSLNSLTYSNISDLSSMSDVGVMNVGGDARVTTNFYWQKTPDCILDARGYRIYPRKSCYVTFYGRSDDELSRKNNYTSNNVPYVNFYVENTEGPYSSWLNPSINGVFTNSGTPASLRMGGLDSYLLDLRIMYGSGSQASPTKHDFGTSAKAGTNFYGQDTTLIYHLVNSRNGPAYFKIKLADAFSGTIYGTGAKTWSGLTYTNALTSYTDTGVMDIGGEYILGGERWASNLYYEKSSDCQVDALGYKIAGNKTCTITFHGRSDPSLASFTGTSVPIAKWFIENTHPVYSKWLTNSGSNDEYTNSSIPVTLKMKSSGYVMPNLVATYASSSKQSGEPTNDAGADNFGTSTRNEASPTILPGDNAYWKSLTYTINNVGNIETYFKLQLGGGDSSRLLRTLAYRDPQNIFITPSTSQTDVTTAFNGSNVINIGSDSRNNFYWANGDASGLNGCEINSRGYKMQPNATCSVTFYYRGDISVPGNSTNIMQFLLDPTQRVVSNDVWTMPIRKVTGKTYGFMFPLQNYIFSESMGYIKLNLEVTGTMIEGYGYGEGFGYICFDSTCGAKASRDAVTGLVTGYVLSESAGWIKLDALTGTGAVIFNQNGTTQGFGLSESAGWIKF